MNISKFLIAFLLVCPFVWAGDSVDYNDADCEGAWLYENSGDPFVDSSAANNDGTADGDPTHATASPPDGGFSTGYIVLDGDDYMQLIDHIADYKDLTVGSIVCYVNLDDDSADDAFFGYSRSTVNNDNAMWFVWDDANKEIDFLVKGFGSDVIDGKTNTTGLDWEDGSWHDFGYTTDTGENKFYMDGVNVAATYDGGSGSSATRAFFDDLDDSEVSRMAWGQRQIPAVTSYLTGDIDESAIFSRSLDSTEINDIMDNGLAPTAVAVGQVIIISKNKEAM